MFIHNPPSAINQKAALAPGLYQGNAALYADDSSGKSVFMAEYRATTEDCICAVELFLYKNDGTFDYCNFVRLQNGVWRNNFGEIKHQLSNFLPQEILNLRVCRNMTLSPQVVNKDELESDLTHIH